MSDWPMSDLLARAPSVLLGCNSWCLSKVFAEICCLLMESGGQKLHPCLSLRSQFLEQQAGTRLSSFVWFYLFQRCTPSSSKNNPFLNARVYGEQQDLFSLLGSPHSLTPRQLKTKCVVVEKNSKLSNFFIYLIHSIYSMSLCWSENSNGTLKKLQNPSKRCNWTLGLGLLVAVAQA